MIQRVLMTTINASHPQRGMLHAFGSLFDVRHFDYLEMQRRGADPRKVSDEFFDYAKRLVHLEGWVPDLVFMQLQNTNIIQADAIEELKRMLPRCVLAHWMGDLRPEVSDYLSSICKVTHLSYIAAAGQQNLFMQAGAREVHYLNIGLDWHEDVMANRNYVPPFRVPDVVMCGNYYGAIFPGTPQREGAIRALMAEGIDVGVVGNGWPADCNRIGECHVKEQMGVWTRAKVCLSISNFNEIPRYWSDRLLIALCSGTPVVTYYVPEMEFEFQHGVHCLYFHNNQELIYQVKAVLKEPGMGKRIGEDGRAEVLRNHTWFSRVFQILSHVERIQAELV